MAKYFLRKKKKATNECDGGGCDAASVDGMGTAEPGGPDRWDNIFGGMNSQAGLPKKRKKRKLRRRK